MRKIEERIIEAINNHKGFVHSTRQWTGSRLAPSSEHDAVRVDTDVVTVYLCGQQIARVYPKAIEINSCGWRTNTTKSRLNAILHEYCNMGIYQKDFAWYIGALYSGMETGNKAFIDGMSIPRVN